MIFEHEVLLTINVSFLIPVLLSNKFLGYGLVVLTFIFVFVTIMVVISLLTFVFLVVTLFLSRSRVSILIVIMYWLKVIFGLYYPIWRKFVPTPPYIGVCFGFELATLLLLNSDC